MQAYSPDVDARSSPVQRSPRDNAAGKYLAHLAKYDHEVDNGTHTHEEIAAPSFQAECPYF